MSEPVGFPVPADDLRFLERAARERSPPPPVGRDPPRVSYLTAASVQTLYGYMGGWRRRRGRHLRRWKPPTGFANVVCVSVSSVSLAVELIYFIVCRPDLGNRQIRARLVTPRDVQRIVYLRIGTARGLLNRVRM
ncbi:hypothetical protein R5W23_003334 [Gemmata sp. JC673]|uniref:Uncharacterized protein n=1 Tax=Gemmata algarum TaxID=2975278 RepID=A0ABU5F3Y3_9BACT|nr:hypothetical protein [Gemmata algarum]MDY3561904.1 hypothetical protein [Gemmata algarum]